jgi:hypothetical protein
MILPNVRLGLRREARKRGAAAADAKKKCHLCNECGLVHFVVGGCSARSRLRAISAIELPEVRIYPAAMHALQAHHRDAMRGYGQTNCSPERPKQNFFPTLTS